jgi:hypothetical protein
MAGKRDVVVLQWDGALPDCLEALALHLREDDPNDGYTVSVECWQHGKARWSVRLLSEV